MAYNNIFKGSADSHMAEALRLLRTNLYFTEGKRKRIVLCTSTIPGEGKSFVSTNYAMSVAISGEKVLVIDCDIRRPRIHRNFDLGNKIYGISDVLLGRKKAEEVILKNIETNLDLLPAKHIEGNVTELFLGDKIKRLLRDLKKKYDLIVLDTPPLLSTSDAAILSQYSDGVIFVCGYDMVTKRELIQAKKMLLKAKAKLYGVVVNKIVESGYSNNNYGYYSYTYKYYDDYVKGRS